MTLVTHLEDKVAGAGFRSGRAIWLEGLQHASSILKPGSQILYAGGHIGSACIFLAKLEPTATIYCFEPDPMNYALLLLNLEINKVKNVFAFPYALGKAQGYIPFYRSLWDSSDSRCAKPNASDVDSAIFSPWRSFIPMVNPSEFLRQSLGTYAPTRMDIVLIDTQGADFDIMEAALPLIDERTTVVCEYSPYHLARFGTTRESAAHILRNFTNLFVLHSAASLTPISVEKLIEYYDQHAITYKGFIDICLQK